MAMKTSSLLMPHFTSAALTDRTDGPLGLLALAPRNQDLQVNDLLAFHTAGKGGVEHQFSGRVTGKNLEPVFRGILIASTSPSLMASL